MKNDRWLVSYADLVTLLFAVFTVLFALSQQDAALQQAHKDQLSTLFTGQPTKETSEDTLPSTELKEVLAGNELFNSHQDIELTANGVLLINRLRQRFQGERGELVIRCYLGADQGGLNNSARLCAIIGESLIERGVSAQRLQVVAMGERDPIDSNLTAASALKNFRIEIESQELDR